MSAIRAIMREGKVELLEKAALPDGTEVLITPVQEDPEFWPRASESALASVWDNSEDDVYAELLKR